MMMTYIPVLDVGAFPQIEACQAGQHRWCCDVGEVGASCQVQTLQILVASQIDSLQHGAPT